MKTAIKVPKYLLEICLPDGWFTRVLDLTALMGIGDKVEESLIQLINTFPKGVSVDFAQQAYSISQDFLSFQDEEGFDEVLVRLYDWADTQIDENTRLCHVVSNP